MRGVFGENFINSRTDLAFSGIPRFTDTRCRHGQVVLDLVEFGRSKSNWELQGLRGLVTFVLGVFCKEITVAGYAQLVLRDFSVAPAVKNF